MAWFFAVLYAALLGAVLGMGLHELHESSTGRDKAAGEGSHQAEHRDREHPETHREAA